MPRYALIMAQRVITKLISDVSGEEAQETRRFAADGKQLRLDLTTAEAEQFDAALAPWVAAAQKEGRNRNTGSPRGRRSSEDLTAIRVWARENGWSIGDRGRVSQEIRDAYAAAH